MIRYIHRKTKVIGTLENKKGKLVFVDCIRQSEEVKQEEVVALPKIYPPDEDVFIIHDNDKTLSFRGEVYSIVTGNILGMSRELYLFVPKIGKWTIGLPSRNIHRSYEEAYLALIEKIEEEKKVKETIRR